MMDPNNVGSHGFCASTSSDPSPEQVSCEDSLFTLEQLQQFGTICKMDMSNPCPMTAVDFVPTSDPQVACETTDTSFEQAQTACASLNVAVYYHACLLDYCASKGDPESVKEVAEAESEVEDDDDVVAITPAPTPAPTAVPTPVPTPKFPIQIGSDGCTEGGNCPAGCSSQSKSCNNGVCCCACSGGTPESCPTPHVAGVGENGCAADGNCPASCSSQSKSCSNGVCTCSCAGCDGMCGSPGFVYKPPWEFSTETEENEGTVSIYGDPHIVR